MFGFFKKEKIEEVNNPELFKQIKKDGIDYAAQRFADVLGQQIRNKTVAYKFVLQELDGAIQGNEMAANFAKTCGIPISEFEDSLQNEDIEVEKLQFFLNEIGLGLYPYMDIAAELRIKIVISIMKDFKIGKYKNEV